MYIASGLGSLIQWGMGYQNLEWLKHRYFEWEGRGVKELSAEREDKILWNIDSLIEMT